MSHVAAPNQHILRKEFDHGVVAQRVAAERGRVLDPRRGVSLRDGG